MKVNEDHKLNKQIKFSEISFLETIISCKQYDLLIVVGSNSKKSFFLQISFLAPFSTTFLVIMPYLVVLTNTVKDTEIEKEKTSKRER